MPISSTELFLSTSFAAARMCCDTMAVIPTYMKYTPKIKKNMVNNRDASSVGCRYPYPTYDEQGESSLFTWSIGDRLTYSGHGHHGEEQSTFDSPSFIIAVKEATNKTVEKEDEESPCRSSKSLLQVFPVPRIGLVQIFITW